jgi:uncharacterized protein YegL
MRTVFSIGFRPKVALIAALALLAIFGAWVQLMPAQAQTQSACTTQPNKVAAPRAISLGETVRVTLTLSSQCPPDQAPVDIMLVLDTSASMADDNKLVNLKKAAKAFLEKVDFTQSRVGLVIFNHDAGLAMPLTQNKQALLSRIEQMMPTGKTNISAAIDIAHAELIKDPQGHQLSMVVLTDGYNTVTTDPVPVAAARAKAAGILIATFCAGSNGECDPGLEAGASKPELYFLVEDTTLLVALYEQLATTLQLNSIVRLTVTDTVPANMAYVGGALPAPDSVTPQPNGETVLVWNLPGVFPAGGLSYNLRPMEVGTWPTNVSAIGDFVDKKGLPGQTVFPIPQVIVTAECPPVPLEIFILIDDSNCLAGATLNGVDSKTAIRRGVERVLDQIELGKDTVAVIGYGDTAVTFTHLTDDREAILAGVDAISMRDNSARLDLGYQEVAKELKTPLHRLGTTVLTISITDGPMMQAPELAKARAQALNRQGVRHAHIAVGTIAQYGLLRQIAEPGWFWDTPFGGDVITPYTEFGAISAGIGRPAICPVGASTATPPPTATPKPATPKAPTIPPTIKPFKAFMPLATH